MSWNYRIVKEFSPTENYEFYNVREVYYTGDKADGITVNEISPGGDTIEDLLGSWEYYQLAFKKSIIYFNHDTEEITDSGMWAVK